MREFFLFILLDMARQTGGDLDSVSRNWYRTNPVYGDPVRQKARDQENGKVPDENPPIYSEFAKRVDAWRAKVSDAELEDLIGRYGSFNGAVRDLVAKGHL